MIQVHENNRSWLTFYWIVFTFLLSTNVITQADKPIGCIELQRVLSISGKSLEPGRYFTAIIVCDYLYVIFEYLSVTVWWEY